jgi:hypothetical protein
MFDLLIRCSLTHFTTFQKFCKKVPTLNPPIRDWKGFLLWGIGYNISQLEYLERREDESRGLGAKGIAGTK